MVFDTPISTILTYVVFALVAGLGGIAAYLAWRGRVFSPRVAGTTEARRLDEATKRYLTEMAGLLGSREARSPTLGSATFDEAGYGEFVTRLDSLRPPHDSKYHAQHLAYEDAVALYVERRRNTARCLEEEGDHMTRASGHRVADCISAGKAREVMLTYARSVDPRLEALLEQCEAEKVAYHAMQEELEKWELAIHLLRAEV